MKKALGLIETKGLVAAVAAADKGLKSGKVILEGKEITEPGYVTIRFSGELNQVQLAVAAGAEAARDTGELISSLVISQPDEQLSILLSGTRSNVLPKEIILEGKQTTIEIENEPLKQAVIKPVQEVNNYKNISSPSPTETNKKLSSLSSKDTNKTFSSLSIPETNKNLSSISPSQTKKKLSAPSSSETNRKLSASSLSETNKNSLSHSPSATSKNLSSPFPSPTNQENSTPSLSGEGRGEISDTILRLRREALGKNYNPPVKTESDNDLYSLNVHQLRKLARSTPDFPLYGRQISKANRDELLKLFNNLSN